MSRNNKSHRKTRKKKLIKPFPCKVCITLPMCINKFWDPTQFDFTYDYTRSLKRLKDKCSILADYIENDIHQAPHRKHSKFVAHRKPQLYGQREREALTLKFFYAEGQKDRELTLK